ncbi:hypothetical protein CORC01_04920 [Colletotrichum orchidophilum]|uniref:Major facilitator superfamily (MFS) profile domain-containing protein n=1 Tax=Colletotrichum orchidophilum TaxID=1209926 RepID=A0A1G4BED0_9PEZI|nr:uncharacterized protein CORC01_04920 [Colletotrichum orchidophilum]OHE99784.1 hypothetical protein CORC01_04920 [Colletotrichum orchidophilum]
MAVAAVAPTLVSDTADVLGRRPVYLASLTLYAAANVGIALSKSYAALLGLRVLQALSISGTISTAYGVITDVASPAERGTFASVMAFAITIAPSFGPILSGSISYAAGWTWIFWFLSIAAGLCLAIMVFLLPETSRNVVGNDSIPPPKLLRLPFPNVMRHWKQEEKSEKVERKLPNPLKSLMIHTRRDNMVIVLAYGLYYVVYTCMNAALSVLFIDIYDLNQWQTGLIYLPFGLGGTASAFMSGPLLDTAYRRARTQRGLPSDRVLRDNLDISPVEKARLSVMWAPMIMTVCSVMAFGWVLHFHLHIAIPLSLQFIAGLAMQLDSSVYNVLLVDKNHRTPAAATASSNIVRCALAAITVSFLQRLIDSLGIGWTFTFMSGLCVISTGLFLVDYYRGTVWRQQALGLTISQEDHSRDEGRSGYQASDHENPVSGAFICTRERSGN